MTRKHKVYLTIAGMVLVSSASAQTLTWLGSWGTGTLYYAEAHEVSADGTVVAGWGGVYSPHVAFRWTRDAGWQNLPALVDGRSVEAWGMSADGQVVVGYGMITSSQYRGFRWDGTSMLQYGTLGGATSWAWDANIDGSVVVGAAELSNGFNRAFRWTPETGMVNLGTLPGGIRSVARAVSLDGNVVVGWSGDGSGIHNAFRWTNNQMVRIHNPAWGNSEPWGVSGDGNVVVGAWGDASFTPAYPFVWTAETGMRELPSLVSPRDWGEAWDANYDGSILVGWSDTDPRDTTNWAAVRWVRNGQTYAVQNLNTVFADLVSNGSKMEVAYGCSLDGRYIVGQGVNASTGREEAFLLDTWRTGDTNGDGCIDDSDLLAVLFAFGTPGTGLTRHEDINKDGIVDDADLLEVLFNFGSGC